MLDYYLIAYLAIGLLTATLFVWKLDRTHVQNYAFDLKVSEPFVYLAVFLVSVVGWPLLWLDRDGE